MAVRRFTKVSVMIRSDVCVTVFAALDLRRVRVAEPERVVSTVCFDVLFASRNAFCFFVITRSFGISPLDIDAYHIKPAEYTLASLIRRPSRNPMVHANHSCACPVPPPSPTTLLPVSYNLAI